MDTLRRLGRLEVGRGEVGRDLDLALFVVGEATADGVVLLQLALVRAVRVVAQVPALAEVVVYVEEVLGLKHVLRLAVEKGVARVKLLEVRVHVRVERGGGALLAADHEERRRDLARNADLRRHKRRDLVHERVRRAPDHPKSGDHEERRESENVRPGGASRAHAKLVHREAHGVRESRADHRPHRHDNDHAEEETDHLDGEVRREERGRLDGRGARVEVHGAESHRVRPDADHREVDHDRRDHEDISGLHVPRSGLGLLDHGHAEALVDGDEADPGESEAVLARAPHAGLRADGVEQSRGRDEVQSREENVEGNSIAREHARLARHEHHVERCGEVGDEPERSDLVREHDVHVRPLVHHGDGPVAHASLALQLARVGKVAAVVFRRTDLKAGGDHRGAAAGDGLDRLGVATLAHGRLDARTCGLGLGLELGVLLALLGPKRRVLELLGGDALRERRGQEPPHHVAHGPPLALDEGLLDVVLAEAHSDVLVQVDRLPAERRDVGAGRGVLGEHAVLPAHGILEGRAEEEHVGTVVVHEAPAVEVHHGAAPVEVLDLRERVVRAIRTDVREGLRGLAHAGDVVGLPLLVLVLKEERDGELKEVVGRRHVAVKEGVELVARVVEDVEDRVVEVAALEVRDRALTAADLAHGREGRVLELNDVVAELGGLRAYVLGRLPGELRDRARLAAGEHGERVADHHGHLEADRVRHERPVRLARVVAVVKDVDLDLVGRVVHLEQPLEGRVGLVDRLAVVRDAELDDRPLLLRPRRRELVERADGLVLLGPVLREADDAHDVRHELGREEHRADDEAEARGKVLRDPEQVRDAGEEVRDDTDADDSVVELGLADLDGLAVAEGHVGGHAEALPLAVKRRGVGLELVVVVEVFLDERGLLRGRARGALVLGESDGLIRLEHRGGLLGLGVGLELGDREECEAAHRHHGADHQKESDFRVEEEDREHDGRHLDQHAGRGQRDRIRVAQHHGGSERAQAAEERHRADDCPVAVVVDEAVVTHRPEFAVDHRPGAKDHQGRELEPEKERDHTHVLTHHLDGLVQLDRLDGGGGHGNHHPDRSGEREVDHVGTEGSNDRARG
mmetsp:Transcript_3023/g.6111  ORF Transcript_3023/g.6111 Transcript_3023/m.6111 type:complete len:1089 (+) Transcript_3023:638-3904(+)